MKLLVLNVIPSPCTPCVFYTSSTKLCLFDPKPPDDNIPLSSFDLLYLIGEDDPLLILDLFSPDPYMLDLISPQKLVRI